jgi:hypothetical protein
MVRKTEENVIQRKKFEECSAYIVCGEKMAMECRQVSTKVNGGMRETLSGVLIGSSQFVGRPEGELQWQANVCQVRPNRMNRRMSGFFAYQVLWKWQRVAVCHASSLMCATHLIHL